MVSMLLYMFHCNLAENRHGEDVLKLDVDSWCFQMMGEAWRLGLCLLYTLGRILISDASKQLRRQVCTLGMTEREFCSEKKLLLVFIVLRYCI